MLKVTRRSNLMSMEQYEERRKTLYKTAFSTDPVFEYGNYPFSSKVISFFSKRRSDDPVIDVTKCTPKVVNYEILVDTEYLRDRLNHTIKFKKKWTEYTIYTLSALQEYLDMCDAGGYKKCILSKAEFATIADNKRK